MKRMLAALSLAVMLAVPVLAGPTIGVGAGYWPDTVWVAPSVGMQWLNEPIGVDTNLHLAAITLETGDDFDIELAGFWEIFTLTWLVDGDGAFDWRLLAGVGTPFAFVSDEDALQLVGGDLGWLFGLSCEVESGSGAKILGFLNGDGIGVGITGYFDLFPAGDSTE